MHVKNRWADRAGGAVVAAFAVAGLIAVPVSAADAVTTVQDGAPKPGETSFATCPEGTQLVGGGYRLDPGTADAGGPSEYLEINGPALRARSWSAKLRAGTVRAFALCDRTSAPTRTVAGEAKRDGEVSYVECPAGTGVIAGGFAGTPLTTDRGDVADVVATNAPSGNGWAAARKEGWTTALALCRDAS
ncbi:hypothetical protein [Kitasatospora griseola]|uniref:hypothetical protein n=1 Tax=Kitasatospora griseola TaxID=2064 RepID=UPI00380F7322